MNEDPYRPSQASAPAAEASTGSFLKGFFSVFGVMLAILLIGGAISALLPLVSAAGLLFFVVGIAQLLWVVPLLFRAKGKVLTQQGIITAAIIVALLNGGCWVVFMSSLS